jgi:putative transposase
MQLAPQEIRTFFVTAVTWQRRPIFRAEPIATLFIDTLFRYREQRRFALHEFVIMPDHFHLLLTPGPDTSLEKSLQLIKGGFSFRVKREMNSNLEIWQGSFTNHRIAGSEDYERHREYIRNNPVRAGLVDRSAEYPYSSAIASLPLDLRPPWLKPAEEEIAMTPA